MAKILLSFSSQLCALKNKTDIEIVIFSVMEFERSALGDIAFK